MKSVPLAEVCEIQMGQAPKGDSYNNKNEGLPLIAGAGDFGDIVPSPGKFTSSPSKVSQRGDIILCIRATIGDLNYSDAEYCLGRGVAGLRVNSTKLDARYLWQWISANKTGLAKKGKGSTFKQVSRSDISEWEISLPDTLEEQRRIAAILDKADTIRQKRKSALTLADTFLRATFLDMFGAPVTNPKGWEIRKFGELLDMPLRNGISPSRKGIVVGKVLTLSAITRERFDESQVKEGMFDNELARTDLVDEHDFLICRGNGNRNLVGKGYFATSSLDDTVFPDTMIAARPNLVLINSNYLEFVWKTESVRDQIIKSARTTNGTYKVNQTAIQNIQLMLPPMEKQLIFSRLVKVFKRQNALILNASQQTETLFASLSQRAFKGEL